MGYILKCSMAVRHGDVLDQANLHVSGGYWSECFLMAALHAVNQVVSDVLLTQAAPSQVLLVFDNLDKLGEGLKTMGENTAQEMLKAILSKARIITADPLPLKRKGGSRGRRQ